MPSPGKDASSVFSIQLPPLFFGPSKKDFVPNDFTEKIILKSKYLRVEHIGNMNKLKDTINYVYKEIIPKNNILVENRQFVYFEKYDYKFHWNREDSVIEIYIPIK